MSAPATPRGEEGRRRDSHATPRARGRWARQAHGAAFERTHSRGNVSCFSAIDLHGAAFERTHSHRNVGCFRAIDLLGAAFERTYSHGRVGGTG